MVYPPTMPQDSQESFMLKTGLTWPPTRMPCTPRSNPLSTDPLSDWPTSNPYGCSN